MNVVENAVVEECVKCKEFDVMTSKMAQDLFSQDELCFLTINLTALIQQRQALINSLVTTKKKENMAMAFKMRKDCDFAGFIIGKFLMGLEEENKKKILDTFAKGRMRMDVTHQVCPHKKEEPTNAA